MVYNDFETMTMEVNIDRYVIHLNSFQNKINVSYKIIAKNDNGYPTKIKISFEPKVLDSIVLNSFSCKHVKEAMASFHDYIGRG